MRNIPLRLSGWLLTAALASGGAAFAATTQLSDTPLANATAATVLPNLFFVLDDSSSMSEHVMPDGVAGTPEAYCSAINTIYYNPLLTYPPPKKADGSSKQSYDNAALWTSVPVDGYGVQSTATVNLTAPDAAPYYYTQGTGTATVWCLESDHDNCKAYSDPENGYTYEKTVAVTWACGLKVEIRSDIESYPGPNGTTRSYAQEMTNFANWKAWHSTRMQMMKTAMSLAFADVRGNYDTTDLTDKDYFHARVGLSTIHDSGATDGPTFLAIADFDAAQKIEFYDRLSAIAPGSLAPVLYTPLRGALSKAGRLYAGKLGSDPLQYSCQRNFTLLTTDGYWNTDNETSMYGPYREDNATEVGDQDGASTATRPEFDALAKGNTLADIAYYYYHTDLRPGDCAKCTDNVPPAGSDATVDDVATYQHMTTFTIGLGVNGTLAFEDGYKTSTSVDGDYYKIKHGSKNWPDPIEHTEAERIDDLWHAAVNGRGTYFSARNAQSLVDGLTIALGIIKAAGGSGAAAATSTLEPTAGDNAVYLANYRSSYWDGELSAYTLDPETGAISNSPSWQASGLLQQKIAAAGDADSRTIYKWSGDSSGVPKNLASFTWDNLSSDERAYFRTNQLSQYAGWSSENKSAATGMTLLNYLRGQDRNEDQERDVATYGAYHRLYRDRQMILGDIVHAQPVFVKVPFYDYLDPGYAAFKTAQATRLPTVYVAANDGMLHAFNAGDGSERWAYVPPPVLRNLFRLADKDYPGNHRFYVDGPIAVSDIRIGDAWKTILVGGLGKGGRGFYAVDITDPEQPQGLWNYTADDNPDVGYSYGMPIITKTGDGTWVVLVGSGYNNVAEGSNYHKADGRGHLFVLDAATGALRRGIDTGVGSPGTPAGLAYLNVKVNDFQHDNTALGAYGGDLLGNLWRFNLDTGAFSKVIERGSSQPITVAPEVGEITGHIALFFGTGRYLGPDDLGDDSTQSFYAVKDDGATTIDAATIGTKMVKQTMANTAERTVTGVSPVDWNTKYGWYVDLPAGKERVHLAAQLYFGTILFASTIPAATACQPGGSGVIYALDAASGFKVKNAEQNAWMFASPVVGLSVVKLADGTAKFYGITADGGFPQGVPPTLPTAAGGLEGSDSGWRVMWRELTN